MRDPDDLDEADADDPLPEAPPVDVRDLPIRFSSLKQIDRSPLHYRHAALYRGESRLAQRMGTAGHAAAFGTPPIAVFPGKVRRGKEWDAFEAANAGAVICNAREAAQARAMAAALRADPVVAPVLFGPDMRYEVEVRWEIMLGGRRRQCGGRIDALGDVVLVDLKCLRDGSPNKCQHTIRWSDYHTQAVWYADGCERAGLGFREPMIAVVENTAPYPCVLYQLGPRAIDYGRSRYLGWLEKLAVAESNNAWHGYAQQPAPFEVPDDEPFTLKIDGGELDLDDAAA